MREGLVAAPAETPRRFANREHAALNALWIGIQFQDAALVAIVVPALVLRIAPRGHTATLALLATLAGTAVALVPPFAGGLSDWARRRGGDRRVETALALFVDVLALGGMAACVSIGQLAVALVAATVALTTAQTIYQALLPDVVPRGAWGTSAGFRGAMTLVGTVIGLLCAAKLPPREALLATAAIIALTTGSLALVPRSPAVAPPKARAVIRDSHDLNVTLVARGWIVLGMTLLNTYVLFFFSDVLNVRDASLGTGLVAGAALIGAIASSVIAGRISDRVDRRKVVALSGVPMVVAALGFALAPERGLIYAYAVLFGLGYGGIFSVGWALALDAVPELGDVARDLGIWGTLSNLPAVLAPALGAWIIARGHTPADGYRLLFGTSGACFAIGSLIVLRVGATPVASAWSLVLEWAAMIVRQPYIHVRVRIRQWGRLPFRRGPTVLIANHEHEDESEIVAGRAFLQGPWKTPIFTASSRRLYEPGFFAWRMPWLAPVMRNVNAGPLFAAIGMLPLENELSSRPLRSIAFALDRLHGDLDVRDVFRDEALPLVPDGARRLSDLRAARFFYAGERRVKLLHVRDPYRRELLAEMRASVDEDIARIVGVVKRGVTFYVTPEGFYSTDGRMRPLKGIVDHLVRVGEPWLAAIAFDPFRGRRLSMLYRVLRPADPDDLGTSLAAARPVTTSALLATWLLAVDLPFEAREAVDGVTRLREAVPPGGFVDPELRRDTDACVREALAKLAARGTLLADGGRYRLGPHRADPHFPDVADMPAFQANFHAETVAALRKLAGA
ncbi:MAG TPA: MFS transporter [Candidatus Baltobacteraceae bacterium]|nr:MFS transporter [Candidatus Baltobacteraceae bacterium]